AAAAAVRKAVSSGARRAQAGAAFLGIAVGHGEAGARRGDAARHEVAAGGGEEGGADQGPGRAPRGGAQGGADARAVALSLEARIRRLPGGKRRQRWAAVRRHRTRSQRIVSRLPGTIRRMNTPSSVVGCSSCGALHTPAPGDRGLCSACRRLLVSDVPWRADATGADPRNGGGASPKRPEKEKLARVRPIRDRSWRRIAIGAGVAVIVA